ncbi:hypothetical protein XYCOK13_10140 [Xylanibacillus composti]|uniref:Uncharacterized protein n=1 Tax=Xylanibacillus composti TaxID=1572762 RepID=A0A8J4M0V4_9BACL|nr:hypothetical protein XYCOK13_10140 [Xylanibacillus composti]
MKTGCLTRYSPKSGSLYPFPGMLALGFVRSSIRAPCYAAFLRDRCAAKKPTLAIADRIIAATYSVWASMAS